MSNRARASINRQITSSTRLREIKTKEPFEKLPNSHCKWETQSQVNRLWNTNSVIVTTASKTANLTQVVVVANPEKPIPGAIVGQFKTDQCVVCRIRLVEGCISHVIDGGLIQDGCLCSCCSPIEKMDFLVTGPPFLQ